MICGTQWYCLAGRMRLCRHGLEVRWHLFAPLHPLLLLPRAITVINGRPCMSSEVEALEEDEHGEDV